MTFSFNVDKSMAHDLLALPDADAAIQEILKRMKHFFSADRTAVFEYDGSVLNRTYQTSSDKDEQKEGIPLIPAESCSFWLNGFDRKGFVMVPDTAAIDSGSLAMMFQHNQIKSLAAVPLRRNGRFIGLASISNPRQKLKQIERLSSLGDYISVLLSRRDLNTAIEDENKEKLAVMNGIPGGFVRMKLHPDGHTSALYHSEGFQRLVGMNAEELMKIYGDDSTSGVHPDDLHIVHEAIQTMQKQGETQNVSYRLRNGSGGYTAVTIFGKKHINSAGEIYLDVYYANASEQQKREDIQIELLDNLPCGAALYELENNQLKVIHLNRHYWEMVDREPKDYDDISVLSVVHPDDQALIAKSVGEAIRDHHNAICDIRIKCGSGSYRMFHVEGRVIPQDDGKYMICASYTCDTES